MTRICQLNHFIRALVVSLTIKFNYLFLIICIFSFNNVFFVCYFFLNNVIYKICPFSSPIHMAALNGNMGALHRQLAVFDLAKRNINILSQEPNEDGDPQQQVIPFTN